MTDDTGAQALTLAKIVRACAAFPRAAVRSRLRTRRGVSTRTGVPTDVEDVLTRLRALPISTWSYDFDHSSVRHLGPMAQDFAAAFGLGDSDRRIAVVDTAGVALAAIQALARRNEELERRVRELEDRLPQET